MYNGCKRKWKEYDRFEYGKLFKKALELVLSQRREKKGHESCSYLSYLLLYLEGEFTMTAHYIKKQDLNNLARVLLENENETSKPSSGPTQDLP
jgi:hypothetical protein